MALQTFTWNNGTNTNPVELTSSQLANLLKLALNENVVSDVRGHITTASGQIAKYTKWQLNQKYGENLVIHAEEIEDSITLIPVRSEINEGERTDIIPTGMTPSSIKFRLLHSFRNVYGISQSAAQARIHMEGNSLVVNVPEENASWVDEVTVQAIPVYEDWSTVNPNAIASCVVTVTAKEITGIALTVPSKVVYGSVFESEVTLIPNTNTKKNWVTLDATCISAGTLDVRKPTIQGLNVYTQAPSEQCNLTLTVNAYLFDDLETIVFTSTQSGIQSIIPYIQIIVTTTGTFNDITSANPKAILQRVESDNTPIGSPIELTGTANNDRFIYTYGGGNITGDGTEKFLITLGNVRGYTITCQESVTPNGAETFVNASYNVIQTGLYVVYTDGTEESGDTVISRYSFASGKTPCFIRIITADANFAIPFARVTERTNYGEAATANMGSLFNFTGGMGSNLGGQVKAIDDANRDGVSLVNRSETYLQANANIAGIENDPIYKSYNKTITLNGVTYHGYLPLWYHMRIIRMNRNNIAALLYLGNSTNEYPTTSGDGSDYPANKCFTFYSYQTRLMAVTGMPDNVTNYNNTSYKQSRLPSTGGTPTWAAARDNCFFDTNQSYELNLSPIYFIPQ